ncbi:hypothetical protein SAMN05421640_0334 [Ekhidna lutea]|uniref:Lipocalin-like domain-containing protein n=1 Tax=Ekhidna lutea TaxID=447679 RepID=A0A239EUK5_EKHLU|nr:hypothetical protein [Ekhidna lutea]SNS48277.1 hypothetical protein SAMN05421640_0334 [Ekhidna lutea]
MKKLFFIPFIVVIACGSPSNEKTANRPSEWHGEWLAEWETPPESYPGIEDMEFYMNGSFRFTADSLTVTANGYPDCIFNVDTLSHTQSWYVSSDSLFLVNEPGSPGMTYRVASKSEDRIKLQLMDDIFVTLTK